MMEKTPNQWSGAIQASSLSFDRAMTAVARSQSQWLQIAAIQAALARIL